MTSHYIFDSTSYYFQNKKLTKLKLFINYLQKHLFFLTECLQCFIRNYYTSTEAQNYSSFQKFVISTGSRVLGKKDDFSSTGGAQLDRRDLPRLQRPADFSVSAVRCSLAPAYPCRNLGAVLPAAPSHKTTFRTHQGWHFQPMLCQYFNFFLKVRPSQTKTADANMW